LRYSTNASRAARVDDGAAKTKAMIATAGGAGGDSAISEYSPIPSGDQADP